MAKKLGGGDAQSARHRGKSNIGAMAGMDVAKRKDEQRRMWMLAGLGALVVLFTALALMLPAISMTKGDIICGQQEHTHTQACYAEVLACGEEEDADHEHSDDCYEKELACGQEEHTHTDACYAPAKADEPEQKDEPTAQEPADEAMIPEAEPEAPATEPDNGTQATDDPQQQEPAYQDEPAEVVEPETETSMPAQQFYGELRDKDDNVTLAVDVDAPEGALPEGAVMEVKAVKAKDVTDAIQDALDAEDAGKLDTVQAVDITFKDADGYEVEPAAPVNVKLTSPQIGQAADDDRQPLVAHVDDEGKAELVDVLSDKQLAKRDIQREDDELLFDADAFSVYAIVYTVDFHYSVDGEEREVNIAGGSTASLREILVSLGVIEDDEQTTADETKLFMEAIQSVDFSAPELVSVTPVQEPTTVGALKDQLALECEYSSELSEDDIATIDAQELAPVDWALISLQPFTSEETLTITMQDGQVLTLRVTDRANGHWEVWFDGTLGQSAQTQANQYYQGASNVRVEVSNGGVITFPALGDTLNTGWPNTITEPSLYKYVLKGWYNVETGEYFEPGQTTTITEDTVFYADWVPASYNLGSDNNTVSDTPDVSGFVTTELFDYNELINTNFTNHATVRIDAPNPWWTGNVNTHREIWNANGDFAFISWIYNGHPSNSIGMPGNRMEASEYRATTLTQGIYNGVNQDNIEKLFNYEDMVGKTAVGQGNYLFRYNEATGEYYYDSNINAATYNQANQRFYVYNAVENIYDNNNKALTNYLPFNDYPGGATQAQNTGAINYWFGMKNTINFYLPDDVGSANANKIQLNGGQAQDMVFKFSGDDDVWVFVDGNLVLDLGGIHNRAGGYVNFSTGKVTTFFGTMTDHGAETTVSNPALSSLKSGNHTLTVLYLERGSSLSNCAIYFNLLPEHKTFTLEKRIAGLADADLANYKTETFEYLVKVKGKNDAAANPYTSPDNAPAIKHLQDGTTTTVPVVDGKVELKHGEYITLQNLDINDTVFVTELNTGIMKQYETPTATRDYTNASGQKVTSEAITLAADNSGWSTSGYKPAEADKITYTNTLQRRDLDVEKKWVNADKVEVPSSITFTVQATVSGDGGEVIKVDVPSLMNKNGSAKTFTLSDKNSWKTTIPDLPKYATGTNAGKEITYSVIESPVDHFTTEYKADQAGNWTIENTPVLPGKIMVQKQWKDADGNDLADHPESIGFQVYQFSHAHEWGKWDGDNWVSGGWITKVEATEQSEGLEYQVCKYHDAGKSNAFDKNHVNTRVIAKKAHEHEWEKTVIPATCTEQGYTKYHCTKDGSHDYNGDFVPALNHDWDEGVVTTKATCTTPGLKTFTCNREKSHTKTEVIPASGHKWTEWVKDEQKSTPEKTIYTRQCTVCNEPEELEVENPKNVYPGTNVSLDEITAWPTKEAYPNDETKTPNSNTSISYAKSGIFEYQGHYYVIFNDINARTASEYFNGPQNFINENKVVELTGKIIYRKTWNKTVNAGDLFIDDDGTAYVFTERNDMNDLALPPNDKKNRWYCVYDASKYAASANAQNKVKAAVAKMQKVLSSATEALSAADETAIETVNATPGTVSYRQGSVVTTNLTKEQLMQQLGVNELGKVNQATGNMLVEYDAKALETPKNDGNKIWGVDIEVPVENDDGTPYTYYVVESSPAGTDAEWETAYEGQDNGLGDNGVVTITNKQKRLTHDITVLKVDDKGTALPGATFTLWKKAGADNAYVKAKEAVTDATGINNDSSFISDVSAITIGKLTDGDYRLVEDAAPNGYIVNASSVDFQIKDGKVIGEKVDGFVKFNDGNIQITIINKPGTALPNTGGEGTLPIQLAGTLLLVLAGALLAITTRRRLHAGRW